MLLNDNIAYDKRVGSMRWGLMGEGYGLEKSKDNFNIGVFSIEPCSLHYLVSEYKGGRGINGYYKYNSENT